MGGEGLCGVFLNVCWVGNSCLGGKNALALIRLFRGNKKSVFYVDEGRG